MIDPTVLKPRVTRSEAGDSAVHGDPILGRMLGIGVSQGQVGTIEWTARNEDGNTIDLRQFRSPSSSSSSESSSSENDENISDVVVVVAYQEAMLRSSDRQVINGYVVDAQKGLVSFELTEVLTSRPGVYMATIGFLYPPGHVHEGKLMFSNRLYILVDRGAFGPDADCNRGGPYTMQEIRLALRDSAPEDSYLNDKVEWDAAEIAAAILRSVQWYNDSTPRGVRSYDTRTFPYREGWMLGIQSVLYSTAASYYRREQTSYSAAGIALNDRGKAPEYEAKAKDLETRFLRFCRSVKTQANYESTYGTTNSW